MDGPMAATDGWVKVLGVAELEADRVRVVRARGRQIAVFATERGIRACNNRCPHEGFPLSEGSLSEGCALTCNWHNWKFDLDTGDNAWGGDRLRVYPVDVRDGDIWLDLSDPPIETQRADIRRNLHDAFADHDYARIAREVARLTGTGGDPLDVLRWSIAWSFTRYEFGWTHAYAGMADWLVLHAEHADDPEAQMVCLVESVAHAAFDALRESEYPFTEDVEPYSEHAFRAAIERQDEPAAVALIRGGLAAGLNFEAFERGLTEAALVHYNAFGHSLIYVTKIRGLVARLGHAVAEPLLLSLVRHLVYASREDKIPEFRGMAETLAHWASSSSSGPDSGADVPAPGTLRGLGINRMLTAALEASAAPPEALFEALLDVNADNMLHFDESVQDRIQVSVSGNVGWLDFTHALTFGEAVLEQCTRFPDLWPQGLVQLAAFSGRNSAFTDFERSAEAWQTDTASNDFPGLVERVLDHGLPEYILSVHRLKTLLSVRTLCRHTGAQVAGTLTAAVRRFLAAQPRRRNPRRTAHQSMSFVAKEN